MKAQIVSFHCVLSDPLGKVISSTFNNDIITQIGRPGVLLQGLTEGLQNLQKGERRRITLLAEHAYGFYDPQLVIEIPRKELSSGERVCIGQEVLRRMGDNGVKIYRVTQTSGDSVTLDGNHPLAGQDLVFDIETTDARDATSEEIAESAVGMPVPCLH